jgi:hypothetical protein
MLNLNNAKKDRSTKGRSASTLGLVRYATNKLMHPTWCNIHDVIKLPAKAS